MRLSTLLFQNVSRLPSFSNSIAEVPHLFVGKGNRGTGDGESPPINLLCPWADHLISLGLFPYLQSEKVELFIYVLFIYNLPAFHFEVEKSD